MPKIGREFEERLENEAALQHAGMRDDQARRVDDVLAVKENVEVNRSRALWTRAAHAPAFALDAQEDCQKL
jgi:hypothetical protein